MHNLWQHRRQLVWKFKGEIWMWTWCRKFWRVCHEIHIFGLVMKLCISIVSHHCLSSCIVTWNQANIITWVVLFFFVNRILEMVFKVNFYNIWNHFFQTNIYHLSVFFQANIHHLWVHFCIISQTGSFQIMWTTNLHHVMESRRLEIWWKFVLVRYYIKLILCGLFPFFLFEMFTFQKYGVM